LELGKRWISTPVRNDRKAQDGLIPIARDGHVQIDLVNQFQPHGAVTNANITLAGPLWRLPTLYNQDWKSVSKSELERYLSKLVEEQSPQGVDPRYSLSPPGGHFAILQMLADSEYSLDLLVLEATGEISGATGVYRRIGMFSLHHIDMRRTAGGYQVLK
jgi:hypothetical protein